MQTQINYKIEISARIDCSGVNLYTDHGETPSATFSVLDLADEFLDDICDGDGKVYDELSEELEDVIKDFEKAITLLKNAR